tara:strand:- start:1837 stop:2532 length:696 start_codon:yes stop_codon:yes gene_type:complete
MKARDVMTTAVVSAPRDAKVEDAIALMLTHHVSALPVIDEQGLLVGLISEGDLMRRVRDSDAPRRSWWLELFTGAGELSEDFIKARSHRVSDVMTRDVHSVTEDTPVGEIARLLERKRIKRVPVLRDSRVVGIVSRANLLQALSTADPMALPQPDANDRDLRARIDEALNEVPGASVNLVSYTVESGKVAVRGVADSDLVETAVRVAVENVPGVRSVDVQIGRLPAWGYGI